MHNTTELKFLGIPPLNLASKNQPPPSVSKKAKFFQRTFSVKHPESAGKGKISVGPVAEAILSPRVEIDTKVSPKKKESPKKQDNPQKPDSPGRGGVITTIFQKRRSAPNLLSELEKKESSKEKGASHPFKHLEFSRIPSPHKNPEISDIRNYQSLEGEKSKQLIQQLSCELIKKINFPTLLEVFKWHDEIINNKVREMIENEKTKPKNIENISDLYTSMDHFIEELEAATLRSSVLLETIYQLFKQSKSIFVDYLSKKKETCSEINQFSRVLEKFSVNKPLSSILEFLRLWKSAEQNHFFPLFAAALGLSHENHTDQISEIFKLFEKWYLYPINNQFQKVYENIGEEVIIWENIMIEKIPPHIPWDNRKNGVSRIEECDSTQVARSYITLDARKPLFLRMTVNDIEIPKTDLESDQCQKELLKRILKAIHLSLSNDTADSKLEEDVDKFLAGGTVPYSDLLKWNTNNSRLLLCEFFEEICPQIHEKFAFKPRGDIGYSIQHTEKGLVATQYLELVAFERSPYDKTSFFDMQKPLFYLPVEWSGYQPTAEDRHFEGHLNLLKDKLRFTEFCNPEMKNEILFALYKIHINLVNSEIKFLADSK